MKRMINEGVITRYLLYIAAQSFPSESQKETNKRKKKQLDNLLQANHRYTVCVCCNLAQKGLPGFLKTQYAFVF